MPELDPCAHFEQARGHRGGGLAHGQAEEVGGAVEQGDVAYGLGRREEQELPCLRGQFLDAQGEVVLEPAGEGSHRRRGVPAGEFGRAGAVGQFQQGQRVAAGLGEDPAADGFVEPAGKHRGQKRAGVGLAQASEGELGQPLQSAFPVGLADAEDQPDPLRHQPPGDEADDLGRDTVEPLHVVDQADERRLLSDVGEQAEDRQSHEEPVRGSSRAEAEGGLQGRSLRIGEVSEVIEERRAQLVQPPEGQLHLGLDSGRAHHSAALRAVGRVLQQRGLADTGLAPQHQDRAVAVAHFGQLPVQYRAFALPSPQ